MKPPPFRYIAASSIEEAVNQLARHAGRAKVLAGGQSLMPMLNFRLLEPELLVDINRIPGLTGISETPDGLRIGALTRHREVAASPLVARHFPVLAAAMTHVAHLAIRNRGTFGGSLAHADPAAELPLIALLLDARLVLVGPGGARTVAARDFFQGALTTCIAEAELLTHVDLPYLPAGHGASFDEVARRHGDFAMAAAGIVLAVEAGRCVEARIALGGVDRTAVRAAGAERALAGQALASEAMTAAVEIAARDCDPPSDLHGSADLRRHLVRGLVRRGLEAAWQRATGGSR